jgi:DNA-binding transcriptional LysR family regulator
MSSNGLSLPAAGSATSCAFKGEQVINALAAATIAIGANLARLIIGRTPLLILLTEAAVRSQGFALGRRSLVGDYLATGRLVRPPKSSRPADYAYYTATTHAGAQRTLVQAFPGRIETQAENDGWKTGSEFLRGRGT